MTAGDDGRATVREVYQLVDKTRTELSEQVDDVRRDLADRVGTLTAGISHLATQQEHRVTSLEESARQARVDIDDHEKRLTVLETAHDRAVGHIGAWKILGGVGGGAAAIVLGDLLLHWIVG